MNERRWTGWRTAPLLGIAILGLAFGAIACGDDDDDGGSGGLAPGGDATDESYVAQICDALLTLQDEFADILEDASGDETEEEAAELLLPPLENYVANLKRADPPGDVREYHDEVVTATEDAVRQVRDEGNLSAFDEAPQPDEPPAEIQARLNAAADANADCQEANFNFGDTE